MKITIKKAPRYYDSINHTITGVWCDNPDCKVNPEFFDSNSNYRKRAPIKEGTIVAELNMNVEDCGKGTGVPARLYYFCTDCIDLVFQDMRKAMDKSLWIFH